MPEHGSTTLGYLAAISSRLSGAIRCDPGDSKWDNATGRISRVLGATLKRITGQPGLKTKVG
jgi:hypothetical protein